MEALFAIVASIVGAGGALFVGTHRWRETRDSAAPRRSRRNAMRGSQTRRLSTVSTRATAEQQFARAQLFAPRYRAQPDPTHEHDLRPLHVIHVSDGEDVARIEREAPPHVRLVFRRQQPARVPHLPVQ